VEFAGGSENAGLENERPFRPYECPRNNAPVMQAVCKFSTYCMSTVNGKAVAKRYCCKIN